MSFLKITDPAKRDFFVEEFMKTKKNIQRDHLSEKIGDIGLQRELVKLYKPIVDSQSAISKEQNALLSTIKENSAATSNALKALPSSISSSLKAVQFPQYPSIEVYEDPVEDVRRLELGELATKYLQQYASNKKSTDTTFGLNSKDGVFRIGDTSVSIQNDDITVGNKTYAGTPGLWELLTMAKPNDSIYDANDLSDYAEILQVTNAMRQPNNPSKPKSSRSEKYVKIIKQIWEMRSGKQTGKGVVVIPQDPNALVEMLDLRLASYEAGNTGVRNVIVGICDELLRQRAMTKEGYKNLMLRL
jgi:hypothetical protein